MKAILRLATTALAAGLVLAALPARAQEAPAETNPPADVEVGPRELQDFNLQGTVTRPGQTTPAPTPAPAPAPVRSERPAAARPDSAPREPAVSAPRETPRRAAPERATEERDPPPAPRATGSPARSVTLQLPPISDSPAGPPAASASATPDPAAGGMTTPWSWLLAALAVIAGGLFVWWRGRERLAFDGPDAQAEAPAPALPRAPLTPAPSPAPAPGPQRLDTLESIGIVSTRLRPWLDLQFRPNRCVIDGDKFIVDFELALFNAGNAPARAILVEASYFNAGPDQDAEIEKFFANPVGEGGRATALAPGKPLVIRNQLVTPRDHIREFEAGGRAIFVPLVAFNALYRWSAGEGQTSLAFMLGRDVKGDKLAPFRLDLDAREFRAIGALALPPARRT